MQAKQQKKGRFEGNFNLSNQQVNNIKRNVRPISKERIDFGAKDMLISGNNCTDVNNKFYSNYG